MNETGRIYTSDSPINKGRAWNFGQVSFSIRDFFTVMQIIFLSTTYLVHILELFDSKCQSDLCSVFSSKFSRFHCIQLVVKTLQTLKIWQHM